MDLIKKHDGTAVLKIGSKEIQAGKEGMFKVQHTALLAEDISSIPSGVSIVIGLKHGRECSQLIQMNVLLVLNDSKVRVTANYFQCDNCWNHEMDYSDFIDGLEIILGQIPPGVSGFTYERRLAGRDHRVMLGFSLEVGNGTYKDIEQRVNEVMMSILQPVFDACDMYDTLMRKQLGE